jgi:hypothetical protein
VDAHLSPSADAWSAIDMKSVTFFRIIITIHVLLLLLQPVLIGLFLSGGDSAKLRAHEIGGNAVGATAVVLVVASIVVWRRARWPVAVVGASVAALLAEMVQLTMGYDRHLGIHVPLGVALAVGVSMLHNWSFRRRAQSA